MLFTGTETETKAFMAICVETLKRFVCGQPDVIAFVVVYLFVCFLFFFFFFFFFRGIEGKAT